MKRIIYALAALWPMAKMLKRTGSSPSKSAIHPAEREEASVLATVSNLQDAHRGRHVKGDFILCFLKHIAIKFANKCSYSDIYTVTKGNLRQARNLLYALRSRNSYVIALTILFMCLIAALNAPAQSGAAANTEGVEWTTAADSEPELSVHELNVGDAVPDEWWDMPLTLWTAANDVTETITLGDYRGKAIILDFWATWCKSCIANMPRMHQLQNQFENDVVVLPVSYELQEIVRSFFTKTNTSPNQAWKKSFRSVLSDSLFKAAFPNPNGTIPYFALIDPDGLFKGPVTPQYLTANLVAQLIEGNADGIPHLRNAPLRPLMDWSISDDNWQPPVSYHTMLSTYMHGAGEPAALKTYSAKGIQWEYYINKPLILLFGIALESPLPRQANRRIMLVDSAMRFDEHNLRNPAYDPFLYDYCYEAIHPIGTPKEQVRAQLLVDLNTWTGVKGQLVTKRMPCLVIERKGSSQSVPPRNKEIQWFTLETIAWFLNQRYDIIVPPVLDETGFQEKIWMDDSARKGSIADVREVLRIQGFDLVEENRELEMFLLTDSNSEVEEGDLSLTLTKYGYVKEEGSHE